VLAEADLSSSDRYLWFQFSEAVVLEVDVACYEVFDVIEILVYLVEVVDLCRDLAWSSEVAE
jgi:hypothetical protein